MLHILYCIVSIVGVEVLSRVPVKDFALDLILTMSKSKSVLLSKSISDHWKEKVLLQYSKNMALITLKIAATFCCLVLSILCICKIFNIVFSTGMSNADIFTSWHSLIEITFITIVYLFVRSKLVS